MSTKIEVNAMGDACPLPVVKTLKALKQLDGEGAVVTSVDNETAVKEHLQDGAGEGLHGLGREGF